MRLLRDRACARYAARLRSLRDVYARAFGCAPAVLRRTCYAMCYVCVTRLAVLLLGRRVLIAQDSKVLLIKPCWSNKIFAADESERKTLEIRSKPVKHRGRVYVCESGSFFITGMFDLVDCEGPLSEERWNELRNEHKVPGSRYYGPSTYAWWACQWDTGRDRTGGGAMELRELGEKSRMGVRGGDFILKIRTSTGSGRARVKVTRRAHAGLSAQARGSRSYEDGAAYCSVT